MREKELSPVQLRHVFGANLRALSSGARSISSLCRALEINRTQYNRYLNGEAFPRPDVLNRICKHFDVDARILLEPLETITRQSCADALGEISSLLSDLDMLDIPAKTLPEGAYLYYRVSYFVPSDISCSLIGFRRDAHGVMRIRGYMPYASSDRIGLPRAASTRRLRGVVFRQLMGFPSSCRWSALRSWCWVVLNRAILDWKTSISEVRFQCRMCFRQRPSCCNGWNRLWPR
ncbi:Cro/C1-type helix-turn-helix DNA-binding protein [Celeribacter persicus]|uniref:Cro/C1-type helix-turn-helix DNA-binding protein n=1 Tax=Celeribacter persicus TaxID=1651082 RepID=A0A2T5HBG0_9RHOB|nr:Cro/C1-type helix-turn-helix DNA-binding protein [Celeribacter persicus]